MEVYDTDSGLVFHETIVKQSGQSVRWDFECPGPKSAPVRSSLGAPRLYEIASAQLVQRAHGLDAELLSELPASVVQLVWSEIEQRGYRSFRAWKAFVSSGKYDRSSCFEHYQELPSLSAPLIDFLADITSFNCDWLTNLALLNISPFSAADLKSLHKLTNLQCLYLRSIYWPECFLDDKLLTYLAHCSTTTGAFQHLKVLFIEQAVHVTENAFPLFCKFPALKVVCLLHTGVRKEHVKTRALFGWSLRPCLAASKVYSGTLPAVQEAFKLYCERERDHLPDDQKGAVLTIVLGAYRPLSRQFEHISGLLCFERDHVNNPVIPAAHDETDRNDVSEQKPGSKRRKMKGSKALNLETVLDSL